MSVLTRRMTGNNVRVAFQSFRGSMRKVLLIHGLRDLLIFPISSHSGPMIPLYLYSTRPGPVSVDIFTGRHIPSLGRLTLILMRNLVRGLGHGSEL
jgi:hypothetical protein